MKKLTSFRTWLIAAILIIALAGVSQAAKTGTLATSDGKGITTSELKGLMDKYVPDGQSHSTVVILTQCYGGDMKDDLDDGRPKTTVTSATSAGQKASYGGYDDDAAGALKPGTDSDTVHDKGKKGKASGETPTKTGPNTAIPSVDPKNGPVKSRHIIVYAGKPDKKAGRDNDQLKKIKNNFKNEKNTTVYGVGGDGNSPWSYAGTKAGLEKAMKKVKEEMNKKGVDPKKEQFIMFITDHGGRRDVVTTTVVAATVSTPTPLQIEQQVFEVMMQESGNIPVITLTAHQEIPPAPCFVDFGTEYWMNAYFSNVQFTDLIDINGNGLWEPEDGWRATIFVDETLFSPEEGHRIFVGGLYNEDGTEIPDGTVFDIGLGTGAIGKDPWLSPIQVEVACGELTLLEGDPAPANYALILQQDPMGPCEIHILTDGQVTVVPEFIMVDPGNWMMPIDVQVLANEDTIPEGGPGALPLPSQIEHIVICPGNLELHELPLFVDAFVIDNEEYCGQVGTIYLPADINRDCQVNLDDFAQVAAQWLSCSHPGDPSCYDEFPGLGIAFDPLGSARVLYMAAPFNAGMIQPDDIILQYMGTPVADGDQLRLAIETGPLMIPGQPIDILVDRDGTIHSLNPVVELISTMPQYQNSCGCTAEQILVHDTGRYFAGLDEPGEYVGVASLWMTVEPDGSVTSKTSCSDSSGASFEGDGFLVK